MIIVGIIVSVILIPIVIILVVFYRRGVLNFDDPVSDDEIKFDCESVNNKKR